MESALLAAWNAGEECDADGNPIGESVVWPTAFRPSGGLVLPDSTAPIPFALTEASEQLLPAMPAQPRPEWVQAPVDAERVEVVLNAEIWSDLESGEPALLASTLANEGDVAEVSPAQLRKLVSRARADLDRIEAMAARYEAAGTPPVPEAPRTWSFTDSMSGHVEAMTCMSGCTLDHTEDSGTPTHPHDIWCQIVSNDDAYVPVISGNQPEELRLLSATIDLRPFSTRFNERLPHASVEIYEDAWVNGLDPESLVGFIDIIDGRLSMLRALHTRLVDVRAEYRARS